eukprot:TRINITY_DN729_c0_g1_i4.p1 TRINITY_DN729_c0_g1~~TRINITY_DN729_c0_g1_i4.p1  ORF type:complete len:111 (-),score=22.24 TRINITY_DN729_c0_g1_i4:35-367(-)
MCTDDGATWCDFCGERVLLVETSAGVLLLRLLRGEPAALGYGSSPILRKLSVRRLLLSLVGVMSRFAMSCTSLVLLRSEVAVSMGFHKYEAQTGAAALQPMSAIWQFSCE